MSFLIGLLGKSTVAGETAIATKTVTASSSSGLFGSLFSGTTTTGILSTLLNAGSTVMKSEYELYASIAGGVFLVISNARKK